MAVKITRKPSDYISETAYIYDQAKTSKYFDKGVYNALAEAGADDALKTYMIGVADAKDKEFKGAFNQHDYDYLTSYEDKANYFLTTMYDDPNSESYKQAMDYYQSKVQETIDAETYAGLNAFERTMSSIGGIVGNVLNETLLGTVEGLVDLGAVVTGNKDWAATDFTGVGANRENLQEFSRKYSYLDKNKVWSIANDVAVGIGQMVPMIALNIPAPGLGTAVYFGGMAGNTAADAVRANPDIDYGSLLWYTGLTTGVEYATERISAGIFGGAGNFIDQQILGTTGKGLTKLGQATMGSWVGRIGLNFLSEGLEESIAEFANTALYNVFIAQGNDDLRKSYSVEDILYAGLVGGLIGGLMEGGRVATTSKLTTPNGKKLSKTQSLVLSEQLAQANRLLQTDAVADLKTKYKTENIEQIKTEHAEEYQEAVEKNKKLDKQMTEIALGLSKIYEIAGAEKFNKAVDLVNGINENSRRLLSNYVNYRNEAAQTEVSNRINKAIQKKYGDDASFTLETAPSAEQLRLQQNLKNKYGIAVYFGEFGAINNKKFGLTISENEIVLDTEQFGKMSEEAILNDVVKEELVHTLQFTKGILTPRTLYEIYVAMGTEQYRRGELFESKQALDNAYKQETGLTQLSEAQAKAVAEVLLFDKLTVSKMFYTQYSTLNKVYNVLHSIKEKLESHGKLRQPKNKVKYNTLLHTMQDYREIAAQKLGTAENVETFVKDYQLTEQQAKTLRETYLENPDIGPIEGYEELAFRKRKSGPIEGQISMDEEVGRRVLEGETVKEDALIEQFVDEVYKDVVFDEQNGWTVDENDNITISDEPVEVRLERQEKRKQAAKEQEDKMLYSFEVTKELDSRVDELLDMLPAPVKANYKGELPGELEYIPVKKEFRDEHSEWFEKITPEDYVKMLKILKARENDTMRTEAAVRYLTTWAYEHANTQFSEITDLVLENYARQVIDAASQLGLASYLYGENTIRKLANQIFILDGLRVELTSDVVSKFIPENITMAEYEKQLREQLKDLDNKIKNTKDSYERYTLRQKYNTINEIVNNIRMEDWNGTFDAIISDLRQQDANQVQNAEKIAEMQKAAIEFFVLRTKTDGDRLINFSADNRKVPDKTKDAVLKVLSGIEMFRYAAMLSSPATWLKNKLSNKYLAVNAMLTDVIAGAIESSKWLQNEHQLRFHGEYNDNFSSTVDTYFLDVVKSVTGGNKYADSELRLLLQDYKDAKAKNDHKILSAIQQKINKVMNDQPDVVKRTMRNLKQTLAGSISIIQNDVLYALRKMYRGKNTIKDVSVDMLKTRMKESNSELYELLLDMQSDSQTAMSSALELAVKLDLPIVSTSLDVKDSVLYTSLYRANKLFFKLDNKASQILHDLERKGYHKTAAVIKAIFPFVRTTFNTSLYMLDHSPVGIVKGIMQMANVKKSYIADQRQIVISHYKEIYMDTVVKPTNGKYKLDEFQAWCAKNVDADVYKAIQGDNKLMTKIYNEMVADGRIPADKAMSGSTNPAARAMAIETLSQGIQGSVFLSLGVLCAFLFDFFDYDEDDYLGPCVNINGFKIALNDLTPAASMFAVGAMLNHSDKFGDNMEAAMGIIIDSTFLSTIDSSIAYNQDLGSFLERQTINWTQQYIPSILKSVSKLANNEKKDLTGNFWNKLWKTTLNNSGVFAWAVPNQINPYTGEPLKYYESGFIEGLWNTIMPIQYRNDVKSKFQRDAELYDAETAGLSGSYTVNEKDYKMTDKQKAKYAKYKAERASTMYDNIVNNREKVTIKNKKTNKYEEKYWRQLDDNERQRVLKSIYSASSEETKIKWWIETGNRYVTNNKDKYYEYVDLFGKTDAIQYVKNHTGSNFVEG
jgi:hypothetical protein